MYDLAWLGMSGKRGGKGEGRILSDRGNGVECLWGQVKAGKGMTRCGLGMSTKGRRGGGGSLAWLVAELRS